MQVSEVIKRFVGFSPSGIIAINPAPHVLSDMIESGFDYHFIINRSNDDFRTNAGIINRHCVSKEWDDYPMDDVSVCLSSNKRDIMDGYPFCIINDIICPKIGESGIFLDELFIKNKFQNDHICSLTNFNYLYVDCNISKRFIYNAQKVLSQVKLIHLANTHLLSKVQTDLFEIESRAFRFFKTTIYNEETRQEDIVYLNL